MAYKYLILDSRGSAVAHGISEQAPGEKIWRLKIDDGDIERVMSHTNVSLVGNSDAVPALEGKIIRREGNLIYLEPVRPLEESVRKNLRLPVRFSSFLYPVSGHWKGREPVVSYDLSCGGVAFYCARRLEVGELAQLVVPVTAQPLVLLLKILRFQPTLDKDCFYAARFTGLIREEENMVREAVFSLQLQKN